MTSQYNLDSQEISYLQFHSNLDQEWRNVLIKQIERRMEKQEQLELNGKGTGYYND